MARYSAFGESAATLAVDTTFANLQAAASIGYKLRRVTVGVRTTTGVVPTSQQCVVGLNRATAAGTGTITYATENKLDPDTAASGISGLATAWATTPPTLTATDAYRIPFNSQSSADLPWELLEEFICPPGAASGIAFVNRAYALPTNHLYVVSVEWEL